MGLISAHFSEAELRCPHCHVNNVTPDFLSAMEVLRREVGGPIALRSAYRCPVHNRAVGGARNSQHMYGKAADLVHPLPLATVLRVKRFAGIGTKNGLALHVDVRNGDTNWTGGSVSHPTMWRY